MALRSCAANSTRDAAALAALMVTTLLLAACASTPRRAGTPPAPLPAPPVDVNAIPDAVPRVEARSTRGNPPFYEVAGRRYTVLASAAGYVERGVASWYGPDFHGKNTSSGEPYDMYAMTAAHKTLPLPSYARITNLSNGRSIIVRINDRGPFVANRVVDLSYTAAARLDMIRNGTAFVELQAIVPGEQGSGLIASATAAPTVSAPPVVAPVATPAPAAALANSPAPTPASSLYIQVGAFAAESNAQQLIARLQAAGIERVFSLAATGNGGQRLRRVRIGPVATVGEFDRIVAQLDLMGYPDARLALD
jgi:rare lipoprotein A